MKKNLSFILAIIVIAGILLSACGGAEAPAAEEPAAEEPAAEEPTAEEPAAPAATEAAPAEDTAEDTIVSMVPAQPGAPFDINGKVVCYLIPHLRILS